MPVGLPASLGAASRSRVRSVARSSKLVWERRQRNALPTLTDEFADEDLLDDAARLEVGNDSRTQLLEQLRVFARQHAHATEFVGLVGG